MSPPGVSDGGLGDWIRKHVEDPRVRQLLMLVVALILIGTFALKAFKGLSAALEILLIEVCFIYVALILMTITVAVWPLNQDPKSASSALKSQRNARGSVLFLTVLGIVIATFAVNVVAPVWPALVFEIAYRELTWGLIGLPEFFRMAPSTPDQTNNAVALDVSDPGSFFEKGQFGDIRKVLRLMSQNQEVTISELDLHGIQRSAVIVARKIVFDTQSAIELGRTSLLIIASDVQVKALPTRGAAIFAYRPDHVLPPPTGGALVGDNGAPAGNITIVILGEFAAGPQLLLDIRGQHGGEGPKGRQPDPQVPSQIRKRHRIQGSPSWTFGPRSPKQIDERIRLIDDLLRCRKSVTKDCVDQELVDLDDESVAQLEKLKASLQQCKVQSQSCNLEYCIQTNWDQNGKGDDGEQGRPGNMGGKGGSPGDPGRLSIYRRASNSENDVKFASHFRWLDGAEVDKMPPPAIPGAGGPGSEGGQGAPGSSGFLADPLGLCRAGEPGKPGQTGLAGSVGPQGNDKEAGASALIGIMRDF